MSIVAVPLRDVDDTLSRLRLVEAGRGRPQQDLVREVKETERNYLLYVQKREEARIGNALDSQRIVNVAIAEAATMPALPAHQNRAVTLLLGILVAGLVAVVVVSGRDRPDSGVSIRGLANSAIARKTHPTMIAIALASGVGILRHVEPKAPQ